MTLIIGSATQDCQFILADRRIIDMRTGNIYDDESYKIVIYQNPYQNYAFAIGYTGLAVIGSENTVDWLMNFLPKVFDKSTFIYDAITNFNNATETLFRSITSLEPKYKAITFVLTGIYNPNKYNLSIQEFIPFLAIISNSIDERGKQIQEVSGEFSPFSTRILKPKNSITVCRGNLNAAQRHIKELRQMFRYIRRSVPCKSRVKLGVNFIKCVASDTDTIGKDVIGVAIISIDDYLGFDFPGDEYNEIRTMPPLVSASGTAMKNFKVSPINKKK